MVRSLLGTWGCLRQTPPGHGRQPLAGSRSSLIPTDAQGDPFLSCPPAGPLALLLSSPAAKITDRLLQVGPWQTLARSVKSSVTGAECR